MQKLNLIKQEFDHLLKVHYLNSASKAIPPKSVQKAYHSFMDDYVELYGDKVKERFQPIIREAREQLAKLINAKPSEIGFVKNTSEGIGIIANGYPFKHGDNIILTENEHPANKNVWVKLQKQGLEIRFIPTVNRTIRTSDIEAAIDDNTVALGIASVHYTTGLRNDLSAIGQICKTKDILLIVDAIQSVGRLELDVKADNIDYLSCGGHKGLLGTYGVGFIYCNSELIKKIIPPFSAHQSASLIEENGIYKLKWLEDARRIEGGNMNYAGIAAINAGAKLINELGLANIESHIVKLEKEFVNTIKGLPYVMRIPDKPVKRSGIVCIEYPANLKSKLQHIFHKRKIYVTFNLNYFRVSFSFFNSSEDVKVIVKAMKDALEF
ncbi:MAG: aminotransferase class V-fold PLP-dependent enzyme [Halanaerobiales bacterium]